MPGFVFDKKKLRRCMDLVHNYDGRDPRNWSNAEWDEWGYDPYKFGYYGTPELSEVKQKALDYIAECTEYLINKVDGTDESERVSEGI